MKVLPVAALCSLVSLSALAQREVLPRYLTDAERAALPFYQAPGARGVASPPPFDNLRTAAEWEEVQALTITWRSFPSILKQITRAAQPECEVIIFCEDCTEAQEYLQGPSAGGPLPGLDNISFVNAESNSIWIRDYGANTVYGGAVDTLLLVDWIYNRPRPDDDLIPDALSEHLALPLYSTVEAPADLVNTGGNFMSDGMGTAWASELVLDENDNANPYNVSVKSEAQIDSILWNFQGISRYIKMPVLPYDLIHHIDMHMKLLNEETLLVGQYPEGVADGPQINANIDYVLNNFQNAFDTDYQVKYIPMPDSPGGLYPDDEPPGYYRTYTNGVFVNKTYIYPSYREEYDTVAARIYQELLPGYTLVSIDCDSGSDNIIALSGAIHCITHTVGVADPLLINHDPLSDTYDAVNPYEVKATVRHRSGIEQVELYWKMEQDSTYQVLPMTYNAGTHLAQAAIPAHPAGTILMYYVSAATTSGKTMSRPIVAPQGAYSFTILAQPLSTADANSELLLPPYPNPATDIMTIPVSMPRPGRAEVSIHDIAGRKLFTVQHAYLQGQQRLSARVGHLAPGAYVVVLQTGGRSFSQPFMIRR